MRTGIFILGLLLCATPCVGAEANPVRALYLSGNHTFLGFVHKPPGKGPFPAVVFNQGSVNSKTFNEGKEFAELAKVFTGRGYVFFIPGRHAPTPGTPAEEQKLGKHERLIRGHEHHAGNIAAAVAWLKTQMYVDETRVVITGNSSGAISSLFALETDLGVRGAVLFSPGVQGFQESPPLGSRMKLAARNTTVPIFLIQSENDGNLLPVKILGAEIQPKGGLNRVKTFPPYGDTKRDAQKFATEGSPVWKREVLTFLKEVTAKAATPANAAQ